MSKILHISVLSFVFLRVRFTRSRSQLFKYACHSNVWFSHWQIWSKYKYRKIFSSFSHKVIFINFFFYMCVRFSRSRQQLFIHVCHSKVFSLENIIHIRWHWHVLFPFPDENIFISSWGPLRRTTNHYFCQVGRFWPLHWFLKYRGGGVFFNKNENHFKNQL